ncbi:adenylate/guanylate cyclase domain-containing protein [Pseudanabaena sp. BC1403]|uniref:adenylate/guanylate cyclase domain-containing protein n=1 Tax=Pseudanabaena sp. BC1403 TaxID=2043171 RepID=UPI0035BC57A9
MNDIFSEFDRLVELSDLEKIKTIGDSYMAFGGLPLPKALFSQSRTKKLCKSIALPYFYTISCSSFERKLL